MHGTMNDSDFTGNCPALHPRDASAVWDMARLGNPPRIREFPPEFRGEATPVFIEGEPYRDRGTWCFAYYGVPQWATPETPAPGIVLVHGGLGTAYPEWVRMWVRRGYAAIAVDTCGSLPVRTPGGAWLANPDGGPRGWGRVECADEPEREQWVYHAVAAAIRSHSFLRSLPNVDSRTIGCTGVSWGGFLSCILAAADPRLAYVAPVYGCGFVHEYPFWLENPDREALARWAALWDPSVYLHAAKCPMLWVDGTNDHAFPLPHVRRSAALAPVPHAFSTRLRMVHGHGEPGEGPREILAFADHFARGGRDVVRFVNATTSGGRVEASFAANGRKIVRAELLHTTDGAETKWPDRLWRFTEAESAADGDSLSVAANLPAGATSYVLNLQTDGGLVFSSPCLGPLTQP